MRGVTESIGKWSRTRPHQELFYRAIGGPTFHGKALEVGCEDGDDCIYLKKKGIDITGIDPKKGAIESARKKATQLGLDIPFIHADPSKLPFKSGSFDALYSKYDMRKLEEKRVIPEMARVLKKGGILYLACGIGSFDTKRKAVDPKKPKAIRWHTRKKKVMKIVEKYFDVIEEQKYEAPATKPFPQHIHKDYFIIAKKR